MNDTKPEGGIPNDTGSAAVELRAGIPVGITREDVLQAIADLDAGIDHPFGPSTFYDLVFNDRRYPPKAVLGLSARRLAGRVLRPHEFSGGEKSECFAVLRALGFEIAPKPGSDSQQVNRQRLWAIALGEGGRIFDECLRLGIAAIGWPGLGDLRQYASRTSMAEALRTKDSARSNPTNDSLCTWQFANEMKPGDRVLAKSGRGRVLGAGIIESDYAYDPARREFPNVRRVRWLSSRPYDLPKRARVPTKTLTDVTDYRALREIAEEVYPELFAEISTPAGLPDAPTGNIWIEITRSDHQHGGAGWEFGKCLWSPSRSADGKDWYRLMRDTQPGDLVLHINDATIQGFSIVAAPCREVTEEPPSPGQWAGMAPFYRVDLRDYRDFPNPVSVAEFVRNNTAALAEEIAADHPHRFPFQLEQSGLVKTVQGAYLCRATSRLFDLIRASVHIPVGGLEEGPPPFTVDDALQDVFLERGEFEEMIEALQRRRNIILQGPPGVGKSFLAKRLAYALIAHKDPSRVQMVQFHQSYAYEDFVQGWRPAQGGGFRLKNGLFYEFCRTARDGRMRVFIIDEINRGNLSKILGELMLLIEHDKRGAEYALPLTYSEDPFYVPENVYIVGLMNTADRSLALVDYALRRRFVFFDLKPRFDSDRFHQFLRDKGVDDALLQRIVDRMSELNGKIAEDARNLGPGFCIGHSFFCPTESDVPDDDWYKAIVRNEIAPLVTEYWFDSPDRAKALIERLAEL